jgi:hypothetical protein
VYADGCECPPPVVGASCASPIASTAPALITGVAPIPGDWRQITFPSLSGQCGRGYRIELSTSNPVNMTVLQSCTGVTVTCNPATATPYNCEWVPLGPSPTCLQTGPTVYWVHLVPTGSALTCMDYSLLGAIE